MRSVLDRLLALESRVRGIPSRFAGGAAKPLYILRLGAGNTVATYGAVSYYGMKRPTVAVTSVPTAIPSTTPGACPDQLSPGYLQSEAGAETLVWVGTYLKPQPTDNPDSFKGLNSILIEGGTLLAYRSVQMQVLSSGVYVPVYIPERIT